MVTIYLKLMVFRKLYGSMSIDEACLIKCEALSEKQNRDYYFKILKNNGNFYNFCL